MQSPPSNNRKELTDLRVSPRPPRSQKGKTGQHDDDDDDDYDDMMNNFTRRITERLEIYGIFSNMMCMVKK